MSYVPVHLSYPQREGTPLSGTLEKQIAYYFPLLTASYNQELLHILNVDPNNSSEGDTISLTNYNDAGGGSDARVASGNMGPMPERLVRRLREAQVSFE